MASRPESKKQARGQTAVPTQCFLSTSSSASHFLVKKGLFRLMISPAKKVVSVGYSWLTEEEGEGKK